MNHEKILESSQGLFGLISICETLHPSIRLMKINSETEGQVFSSPSSASFSCSIDGPGPVSASRYLYAFIIAAWQFPNKHGLVLGLGAGAGVSMLLALFPNLSLTVIEIDSQVIRLSRQYFPMLSFYESKGRLRVIESDAETYLDSCHDAFAFTLLDLFSGDESNHNNLPLVNKVLKISPYFMANIITSKSETVSIERSLNLIGNSVFMWIRAFPAISSEEINWIMTNIDAISPDILDYKLFSDFKLDENVMTANGYFRYILSQIEAACFYR